MMLKLSRDHHPELWAAIEQEAGTEARKIEVWVYPKGAEGI